MEADKHREQNTAEAWISEVETVKLGGYNQKILIEGMSSDLPAVIFLHGGPGNPIPFNVGCRGLFPEITKQCIMVCWDQYGSGINNAKLPQDIAAADFVDMTCDLIRYIKEKFPDNRLYLFGMSWGSVLSARAALKCGEYLDGAFAYGQASYQLMQSEEMLEAILGSSAPEKIKKEIKGILSSKTFTYKSMMKVSQCIRKYTQGYSNKNEPRSPMGSFVKGMLKSPDYRLRDFLAIFVNGYMKNQSLASELSHIDLRNDLSKICVPYRIIQGDTDIVTSTAQIIALTEECKNPYLSCTVVKNSAHIPGENGMKAIMEEISALHTL